MRYEEMSLKDLIRQLGDLKAEVEEKEIKIQKLQSEIDKMNKSNYLESDSVSCGKKGKKPLGTVRITGFPYPHYEQRKMLLERRIRNLADRQQDLLELVTTIEEKIEEVSDSRTRRILTMRYVEGLSWIQVANRAGGSPDSCRNAIDRFLGKR